MSIRETEKEKVARLLNKFKHTEGSQPSDSIPYDSTDLDQSSTIFQQRMMLQKLQEGYVIQFF